MHLRPFRPKKVESNHENPTKANPSVATGWKFLRLWSSNGFEHTELLQL